MFASKDLFAARGGYRVTKSLRFRSSASAYLSRTPGSAGNRTTWTWSAWVKQGTISANLCLFAAQDAAGSAAAIYTNIQFVSGNLGVYRWNGSTYDLSVLTNAVYRDPSAWMHICISVDTTQATASNRTRIYINGVETAYNSPTYPAQNFQTDINATTRHAVCALVRVSPNNYSGYFDGYLAEVNFIDGQALDATSFGQTDNNGVWQPKAYTGTYGTNGFYLKFADASGATATTIGKDSSPNGNNWAPNNISVASGVTYDSMLDSPTNFDDGGNGVGNYAVLNPLIASSNTFSQGNLVATMSSVTNAKFVSTMGVTSGKWYMEFAVSSWANCPIGITSTTVPQAYLANADASTSVAFWPGSSGTSLYINAVSQTFSGSSTTWAGTDIAGLALDADSGTIALYKNGTLVGSAVSYTSYWTGLTYFAGGNYIGGLIYYANFGQRPFAYTPPSGFRALNTQNLTTPTIMNGAAYMDATIYTGNGSSSRTFTGELFSPDLVWIKGRSGATDHALYDAVRGVQLQLESNNTGAETTESTGLTAFTADGFTIGSLAQINTNAATYVAWLWDAASSDTTNTSGSVTSVVRANVTAGFSVARINAPGASTFTFGHGLNAVPKMVIVKSRTSVTSWLVYHASATTTSQYLVLNSTAAIASVANIWGTSSPTSTLMGGNGSQWGAGSDNYIAYCFADVAGYSAFGSYTGNGSTDGPFVYLGFRPRWLMVKNTSTAATDWFIVDSSINTYNVVSNLLVPNTNGAEIGSLTICDFTSNGVKFRDTNSSRNASGSIYIYAAFAENPFKISRAR